MLVPPLGQTIEANLHETLDSLGSAIPQAQPDLAGKRWEVVQKPRLANDTVLGLPVFLNVPYTPSCRWA